MKTEDYTVGWICAVQTEYVAACELLDEEHPLLTTPPHDENVYTLGRIGDHNLIIACLPKGRYGLTSAASVAKDMLRSFSQIRFGLMVGIGGGAPSEKHDIRLGDVVVSSPVKRTSGVIHYEFGKAIQDKRFERTGSLDAPPQFLLAAVNKLSSLHERKGHGIAEAIKEMVARNPRLKNKYQQPNSQLDRLYKPIYVHADDSQECRLACDTGAAQLVERYPRDADQDNPAIHYGLIASADRLMKDATVRDIIAKEEGVLCFEMEAAGLMNHFRCVVIRGICDYSDTHKNDVWQGYAAATAAAYAKELLCVIPGREVDHSQTMLGTRSDTGE
jgi:nucleoside phosphorylase